MPFPSCRFIPTASTGRGLLRRHSRSAWPQRLSLPVRPRASSRLKSCATNSTVKGALSKHVGWSVKIWSCSRAPGAATAEGEGGLLRHRAPQKGRWSFLVSDNREKMERFGEQRALILGYGQGRWARLLWRQQGVDRKSTRLNSSHVRISYAV